nr:hypothetical protein [uncultured Rhodoferax sp.]
MPRVPTYSNLETSVAQQPNVRFQGLGGPQAGAIAAEQASQMGQATTQLGGAVARIAIAEQARVDASLSDAAMNQLIQADTNLRLEALSTKGRDALERPNGKSLPSEYAEKLDQAIGDIESKSLHSTAQKAAFRQNANALRGRMYEALGQHVVRQQGQFDADRRQSTLDTAYQRSSLLYGDANAVAEAQGAVASVVNETIAANGWSPDKDKAQIDALTVKAYTPLHAGVLLGMVNSGNLAGAKAYYDANGPQIDAGVRLKLHDTLQTGEFEARTQAGAQAIWEANKSDPAAALKAAREQFSGKEEDAVVTRIKTLDAERVQLRERAQSTAADDAWRTYTDTGTIAKVPATVLAAMDGKALEALRRTARVDAEARAGRAEVKTDPAIYYALSMAAAQDPNFKKEDLRNYFDKLGPSERKHFIDLQAKANTPDAGEQVVAVGAQKKAMTDALGLKGERAGIFHQEADRALYAAHAAKRAPLDQDERQKILDRLVLQGDVKGKWSNVRLFEAIAEGRADTFKPEWSDTDKRKATAALRSRGITAPTDEQINATLRAVYGVK